MPIIDPGSEPQVKAGMTRQRVIDLANSRTGQVAEKKRLDLDALFLEVLQEFCQEHRWFWRKRSIGFYTTPDVATYDLTDPSKDAIDCATIISVKYFINASEYVKLDPIFGQDRQDAALESSVRGEPAAYFLEPGYQGKMRILNTPDGAYRIRVSFWSLPNTTSDQQPDNIPLVPGFHHHILVKGMVAKITRDPVDIDIYERAVARAGEARDFAAGKERNFVSDETAVRSC